MMDPDTSTDEGAMPVEKKSDSSPRRRGYEWVVLIACGLLFAGVFALVAHGTAGPGYGYGFVRDAAVRAVFGMMIAPWFGLALLVWLGVVWSVFQVRKSWRGRAGIALAPVLIFAGFRVAILVADPPTPQKFFLETFGVELPAGAQVIEVVHPTFADPGWVDFAFTGSAEITRELIATMNLTPSTDEPETSRPYFRVSNWDWGKWDQPHQFLRILPSGTAHLMVTDAAMEKVMVKRDPLFAKSEDEIPDTR